MPVDKVGVMKFISSRQHLAPENKDVILILLNIIPLDRDSIGVFGLKKSGFTQLISKLRSEGQDIRYDPEIGYYIGEKRPYKFLVSIEGGGDGVYFGKLLNIYPAIVRTKRNLKKGVNIVNAIIEGFEGDRIIMKDVA